MQQYFYGKDESEGNRMNQTENRKKRLNEKTDRSVVEQESENNPLGREDTGKLLWQFAVPSIIAMLVSSLYNIVDQFFIGQSVGELGNAATNISFPLSISCVAIALLFGIGGASAFNICMGEGE